MWATKAALGHKPPTTNSRYTLIAAPLCPWPLRSSRQVFPLHLDDEYTPVARSRQVIVIKTADPTDDVEGGGLPPLGTLAEVSDVLQHFNISTDGAPPKKETISGAVVMHGPGLYLECIAPGGPRSEINQMMVTMTDDDFAFPVLSRLCRTNKWTLMDPESGQRLRFGS